MNFFGLILGLTSILIIGLGFVWVIQGEYFLGYLWWPYIMALGITLVFTSLFIPSTWGSALMGVFGGSFVWGSIEFKDQAVRAEIGWYPFNPKPKPNPPFVEKIIKWKPPNL